MEHLDLRKNYDSKELARVINDLMKEIEELKAAINQKVDYSEYRFDPIFYD